MRRAKENLDLLQPLAYSPELLRLLPLKLRGKQEGKARGTCNLRILEIVPT